MSSDLSHYLSTLVEALNRTQATSQNFSAFFEGRVLWYGQGDPANRKASIWSVLSEDSGSGKWAARTPDGHILACLILERGTWRYEIPE